jgi:hypothetical protein
VFPYDQCFFPSLQVQDRAESFCVCDIIISTHEITVNITIPHHYLHYYDCRERELILDGNHTSLAQKNRSQKQMFQMFDAPVAVDGHALFKIMNAKSVRKIIAIPTHYIKRVR